MLTFYTSQKNQYGFEKEQLARMLLRLTMTFIFNVAHTQQICIQVWLCTATERPFCTISSIPNGWTHISPYFFGLI